MKMRLLVLCGTALISQYAAAQQMDIKDFVRLTFIQGVPYEQASQYNSSVVPTLLDMLADAAEEPHWTNIVGVLGIIGDERAVQPLIAFLREDVEGTTSPGQYRAKSSVPMALGYLINKSESKEALAYLLESLDPDVWAARRLTWSSPYHASAADRDLQLATMAIWGLALSGHPMAVEALRSLQQPAETEAGERLRAQVSDVVVEALRVHAWVAEEGLAEYYRRMRS